MNSIDSLIRENIEKNSLLSECSGVVLAVSGGADSMTLLDYFIREIKSVPFAVAHVNHGIRKESDAEEEFLKSYCDNHSVRLEVLRADIPHSKPAGETMEEYSRHVRYTFFDSVRKKYGFSHIATAHNRNDATESFFMNIIRGAGIHGAAGIPVVRSDGVIRPLLFCEKKDVLDHCKKNGIPFVTDLTNFENICTRNVLRNDVLPRLREINPRLDDAVFRITTIAAEDEEYFEKRVDEAINSFGKNRQKNEVPLNFLRNAEKPVISRLLRRVYSTVDAGAVLTFRQTNDIIFLLESGHTSDRVLIANGYFAVLDYEYLRFESADDSLPQAVCEQISEGDNSFGGFYVTLKKTAVSKENIRACFQGDPPFVIRSRKASDRIRLYGRPEKSVKELFIDEKIPAKKRPSMLIVTTLTDTPLWLRGFGASNEGYAGIGENAWEITIKETGNGNKGE
jgi:tRNA(Ile)-lysidine synthase